MTINIIDKMIDLLKDKKKYLTGILKLTKDQRNFIENEDMDGINNIISEKEKLMSVIDLLDLNFLSSLNEVKELEEINSIKEINGSKYSNLRELKEVVGTINMILTNISVIDKENTEIMKKNLENIKYGLRHVKEVKKAYKGYNYESAGSILIDEKK